MDKKNIAKFTEKINLQNHLAGLRPADTIIFTDMSGTLLLRQEDISDDEIGFPSAQRQAILDFIQQNGTLVIVTGDSFKTVRKEFLDPLNYLGPESFYIISGSGYEIHHCHHNIAFPVHLGEQISQPVRETLLEAILKNLNFYYIAHFSTKQKIIQSLLSPAGNRIGLTVRHNIQENLFLEVRPNMVVLDFPNNGQNQLLRQKIIQSIQAEHAVVTILGNNRHIKTIADIHYLDFIASTKSTALRDFFQTLPFEQQSNIFNKKNVLVLGDSGNDLGLFQFNYADYGFENIYKIFVGNNDELYATLASDSNTRKLYLKDQYTEGTLNIFNRLNQD